MEFVTQRAVGLRIEGQYRFVQLGDGREVASQVVLLAHGVQYRRLEIPGASRLTGGAFITERRWRGSPPAGDEEVYVVGGATPPARQRCILPATPRRSSC